jgi:hypothetical protein
MWSRAAAVELLEAVVKGSRGSERLVLACVHMQALKMHV